ncbi:MAG TPA: hypothetical protein VGJ13_05340 [Pseudonocardiaceae bacterium]|jgi:hypothetical protein
MDALNKVAAPVAPVDMMRIGRNWHEAYLLLLSALFGVAGLVSGHSSRAIAQTLPAWAQLGWYVGLTAGSCLGLTGISMASATLNRRRPEVLLKRLQRWRTGLVLERAAMWMLVGLCTAYVIGTFAVTAIPQITTALGASYITAFALANFARAVQIGHRLPRLEAALRVLKDNPQAAL